jgi:hypothetical protein
VSWGDGETSRANASTVQPNGVCSASGRRLHVPSLEIGRGQSDRLMIGRRAVSKSSSGHGFDAISQTKKLGVPLIPYRLGNAVYGIEHAWDHRKFDNGIAVAHREFEKTFEVLAKVTMSDEMHEVVFAFGKREHRVSCFRPSRALSPADAIIIRWQVPITLTGPMSDLGHRMVFCSIQAKSALLPATIERTCPDVSNLI